MTGKGDAHVQSYCHVEHAISVDLLGFVLMASEFQSTIQASVIRNADPLHIRLKDAECPTSLETAE